MQEKRILLGKGPSQGQIPGLQGLGTQIPDRTFTTDINGTRNYVENFRWDDKTISIELIF
jgi:hypothetical protein